jgi:cytochrome c oxidase subunit II
MIRMKNCARIAGLLLMVAFIAAAALTVYADQKDQTIKITAKKFEYTPKEITVKKNVPVVLELTSLDVHHGFNCPDLKLREDIYPGKTTTVRFVPDKKGTFPFHCDVYCGEGHEDMSGIIMVID